MTDRRRLRTQSPPDLGKVWQPTKRGKNGPSTTAREKVIARDGLVCRYCGRDVVITLNLLRADRLTIDHITPRMLGGTNQLENLAVACNGCNRAKGAKLPHEFIVTPKGLVTAREAAFATNLAQGRHQRTHLRRDGQPKRAFDRDEAVDSAIFLAERDGVGMDAFACNDCGMWHIRILPGAAKRDRRQATRIFYDDLRMELGSRAYGQLKAENKGSRRQRRAVIDLHFKGAKRRAKHKATA